MRSHRSFVLIVLATALVATPVWSQTTIPSANGQPWDVNDNTGGDSGYIDDGGQDAFDGWGDISLTVSDGVGILAGPSTLAGFSLTWDSGRRWATTAPVTIGDVSVSRALYAPAATDYMRYVDTFTNTSGASRYVDVVWGGNLGSNGSTTVAATSSGDLTIAANDAWAVSIESSGFVAAGPATDPPVGYVLGDPAMGALTSIVGYPGPGAWPGNGNDNLSYQYSLTLAPGETARLAYFLYRGLEENSTGPLGQTPTTGEEIALAQSVCSALAASPDFGDLSAAEIDTFVNWSAAALVAVDVPTLSFWGALLLSGVIAVLGVRRLIG